MSDVLLSFYDQNTIKPCVEVKITDKFTFNELIFKLSVINLISILIVKNFYFKISKKTKTKTTKTDVSFPLISGFPSCFSKISGNNMFQTCYKQLENKGIWTLLFCLFSSVSTFISEKKCLVQFRYYKF